MRILHAELRRRKQASRRRRRAAELQKNKNKLDEMQDTIDIIEGRVAFIYFCLLNNPEWDKTTHMVSTGQVDCGRREFERDIASKIKPISRLPFTPRQPSQPFTPLQNITSTSPGSPPPDPWHEFITMRSSQSMTSTSPPPGRYLMRHNELEQ